MQLKLINTPNYDRNVLEQILINRGIPQEQVRKYLNLSDFDINEPVELGEQSIINGLKYIISTIKNQKRMMVIVDCDVDGYTSAALFLNYLYRHFPSYVNSSKVNYFLHAGKDHGLKDAMKEILAGNYGLVVAPDSASNDYDEHKILAENGIKTLVIDHHLAPKISEDAVVINNQLSDYPNKELAGVGVVWQFCRAFDDMFGLNIADDFLDLVALGLTGDMMSLQSFETRYLISKGFSIKHIKNEFIKAMIKKNEFSLTKPDYRTFISTQAVTSIGATFFIVPFINAVTRSGTMDEKRLIFESLLDWKANQQIPSTKRGHTIGEMETYVEQAVRSITNIKNRQTKAEDAAMELVKKKIADENLDSHGVILIETLADQIQPEIRGLVANKIMAEFQKPCCVVTKRTNEDGEEVLQGSMRGYTKTGIDSFKDICQESGQMEYVQGHDNAAGISIKVDNKDAFIENTDKLISQVTDISSGVVNRVDYIFNETDLEGYIVEEIATLNDYWGQDIERAHIGVKFRVTPYNFTVMKSNTFKFSLKNGISAIKFKGTEDEINTFTIQDGWIEVLAYCKCNLNEWNGNVSGQLLIEDYKILSKAAYDF